MSEINDDNCDFREITQSNYTKISSTLSKIGYVEGITAGRESVFQNGFDQGYTDGLKTGFAIAKYKTVANLLASKGQNESLINEANQLISKYILDAKSPQHFKLNDNSTQEAQSITEISKAQNNYTDEFKTKIQDEFPIINSLLC